MVSLGPRLKRSAHGLQTRSGLGRPPARWDHATRAVDLPDKGSVSYDRVRVRFMPGGAVRKRQWYFNDADAQPAKGVRGMVEIDEAHISVDNGPQITVWATDDVSGEVTNGADLRLLCGGSMRVNSSDGGSVSSAP